jgi:UDP-N-acetyl-D-mannosaminuronic acid dehydrogenase
MSEYMDKMKVCVLGLGNIGLPVAQYTLKKGLAVWGYDISSNSVKKAKETGIIKATTSWRDIPPVDVYIVCVSTLIANGKPGLSPVFDAAEKISQKANQSSLVSIESTIIPGASRKIYETIFNQNVKLVHVPHRYWIEDSVKRGVKQKRVIGAVNAESLRVGLDFYQNMLKIPLHKVSSVETAEMSKITENAHRFVQIAFAEELKMICAEIGLDFDELRNACNTKWNVDMPEARDGIGGHCLPKDIRYVMSLTTFNTLLESAVIVDKKYRDWLSR